MKTKIFCDIADYKTIKFYNNTEFESDPASATLISSAGNYVTLDTSSVPDNLISNLTIDNSTPGQFIIDVTPTKTDGVVTTSSGHEHQ